MRTSYTYFITEEREKLLIFRTEKLGILEIARRLNRSPSSVSRKLQPFCGKRGLPLSPPEWIGAVAF